MTTNRKKVMSIALAAMLGLSSFYGVKASSAATDKEVSQTVYENQVFGIADAASGSAASGSAVTGPSVVAPVTTPVPTAPVATPVPTAPASTTVPADPGPGGDAVTGASAFGLDTTHVCRMAGKSLTLTLGNIPKDRGIPTVTFSSDNPEVAAVAGGSISTDYSSATANINLLKAGTTVIHATVFGQEFTCEIKVVAAMSEADFGWYHSENFISFCKRMVKKKKWVWAFQGEWGTPEKYGSTYRGIKIGMSRADVENVYGELKLKTCKREKDKFLYEKGFNTSTKKLKVKYYADLKYGSKYVIRVYFTSAEKLFGFNMVMNYSYINKKVSKSSFKKSLGKQYSVIY
ncbi:MAG: hypothetical protein J5819_09375 [Eubacterium sp.]|nr:hypothetical protein [Eubacterium sp.]